jgi:hypothetical protein
VGTAAAGEPTINRLPNGFVAISNPQERQLARYVSKIRPIARTMASTIAGNRVRVVFQQPLRSDTS